MERAFLILSSIFFLLMVYGEGIPEYQDTYFYLGYFAVPFLISFCFICISYLFIKVLDW